MVSGDKKDFSSSLIKMCRKKMEPFKCEYVPVSAIVSFITKHKALVSACFALHQEYVRLMRENKPRYVWYPAGKRYRCGPEAKLIIESLRLNFNYTDKTLQTKDVLSRVMYVYRDNFDKKVVVA
jgi:hypothetical protein